MRASRIVIDGLGLVESHFSGVGQYISGLLRGFDDLLDEAPPAGESHREICVVIPYNGIERYKEFGFRNIRAKRLPMSFNFLSAGWRTGLMPPVDVLAGRGHYIFPRFIDMPLAFSKSYPIVHDLTFELHPELGEERNMQFLARSTRRSVASAERVFTVSSSVKNQLVAHLETTADRVTVAYPAVDQKVFFRRQSTEIERAKNKYDIAGDYIVALSNLEPRKNLEALVDAYCQLDSTYTERVGLLVIGATGWKADALLDKIHAAVERGYNIMRPSSYVEDADKPAVLSGAKMLVYPSHYEGFGIPPLEALACGVPTIAANNSSLPESVGSAGRLVANDPDTLAVTIADVLDNWEAESRRVRRAGPEQAARFSWRSTAQVYLDATGVRAR